LMTASQKIAEQLYKEKQAEQAAGNPADAQAGASEESSEKKDDTIDADITE
jgi:hypothetical protein